MDLVSQLRARVEQEGEGWLTRLLAEIASPPVPPSAAASSLGGRRSSRQSRPPVRLSPGLSASPAVQGGQSRGASSLRQRASSGLQQSQPAAPPVSSTAMGAQASCSSSGFSAVASSGGSRGVPVSGHPVGHRGDCLMSLVRSSVAPATWSSHGKAWAEWLDLVGDRDVAGAVPDRLEVTLDYLLALRGRGFSGSVAARRMSGVAFYFQLLGWSDVTKFFVVRQALKGWSRERVCLDVRRPVSFPLLLKLVVASRQVCSSYFESVLFSTAFALAFFGAMRIGELIPPSRSRPGGLGESDIFLGEGFVRVRIGKSKTDQAGRGTWLLLYAVNGEACPFQLVSSFLLLRPRGPLFLLHEDASPLTQFQFLALFRRCLSFVGLDFREFGTHSFRIGAATEAARAGLSESDVQRVGRWRSACYARYIRPDLLIDF
ncbi:uncharacterized protein LOC130339083 isoform X2 [Hyla sarda]|uniref:uncharacterized protein LOC130339083 isoform X2 n=2 Tax=Hyla sarda TaxID=327740 RepID=UPI0024C2AAEF|nr:uncharacterized protein LOC130339083 isoform X2 [Hyla sarda]